MPDRRTEFREAYHRFQAAQDDFVSMMNEIIEGRKDWPIEERVKRVRHLRRLLDDFVKAGEPFIRPRR